MPSSPNSVRAVLICRANVTFDAVSMTDFDSLDAALDAVIEKPRCRAICQGQHDVTFRAGKRIRTIDAAAAIVRRDIRRALTGDLAAITRLEANLPPQQPNRRSTS